MLRISGDEVIADRNILAESDIQNSCIESHGVEFQATSTSVAENSDQSETQNFNTKQLESQLAGELNQSGFNMAGYSAASASES